MQLVTSIQPSIKTRPEIFWQGSVKVSFVYGGLLKRIHLTIHPPYGLKASQTIGNGLYGVDVKEKDGKGYVIEVNDNPNIDRGIEDKYLGDELYRQVMAEFLRRMENSSKGI
jgi:hypothetical protein